MDPTHGFEPPLYAVRVNACWFLSITASLTAGVIGILCKQWMRYFQRDAALPAKEALALRQLRYMGWNRWGVPQIIASPAILIQIALVLFLSGLIDFVWHRIHSVMVAVCATVGICITFLLMLTTTVLPALYFLRPRARLEDAVLYQCPYKSPQAYLFLKACRSVTFLPGVKRVFRSPLSGHSFTWIGVERELLDRHAIQCGRWAGELIKDMHRFTSLALKWTHKNLAYNKRVRDSVYHCLQESKLPCPRDSNKSHVHFHSTYERCVQDRAPNGVFASLYKDGSPNLLIEMALRSALLTNDERWFQSPEVFPAVLEVGKKST